MEITTVYDDDCDVFNLKGVLVACLKEYSEEWRGEHDIVYISDVADYVCEMLYDYACGLCKENQIPAIVFLHGKLGEFHPIEVNGDDEEVM